MTHIAFVLTKLFWFVAKPSSFLFLGLLVGALLTLGRWSRVGRWLVGAVVVVQSALFLLPVDDWLARPLEDRFPPPSIEGPLDGIIVLGGAVNPKLSEDRGQIILNEEAERMTAFVALARQHPEARLIFTGGSGAMVPGNLSEADVARMLFTGLGLPEGRVLYEGRSRNTWENAIFSKEMVQPKPGERWLLVTSALHMPRAVGVFRKADWAVIPWPVGYRTRRTSGLELADRGSLSLLDTAVHEWLGLLAYRMAGWTECLLPRP